MCGDSGRADGCDNKIDQGATVIPQLSSTDPVILYCLETNFRQGRNKFTSNF